MRYHLGLGIGHVYAAPEKQPPSRSAELEEATNLGASNGTSNPQGFRQTAADSGRGDSDESDTDESYRSDNSFDDTDEDSDSGWESEPGFEGCDEAVGDGWDSD